MISNDSKLSDSARNFENFGLGGRFFKTSYNPTDIVNNFLALKFVYHVPSFCSKSSKDFIDKANKSTILNKGSKT